MTLRSAWVAIGALLGLLAHARAQPPLDVDRLHVPELAGWGCERRHEHDAQADVDAVWISCIQRRGRTLSQLMIKEYIVAPQWIEDAEEISQRTYIPQWEGILRRSRLRQGWDHSSGVARYDFEVRGRHAQHGPLRAHERVATLGARVFVWTFMSNRESAALHAAERRWFDEAAFDDLVLPTMRGALGAPAGWGGLGASEPSDPALPPSEPARP